ncbi:MAG: VCBS repeat-containing protein, partial [Blastocatellia bacterium]
MKVFSNHLSLQVFLRAILMGSTMGLLTQVSGQTLDLTSAPCANGSGLIGLRQLVTNSAVQAFAVADFNRDGKADLALSEIKNTSPVLPISRISIWFGDGQGSFEPVTRFDAPAIFAKLDTSDLNKDGIADLVG